MLYVYHAIVFTFKITLSLCLSIWWESGLNGESIKDVAY